MGIQGLLPFLKKASRQANIKDFKGCTVAIDSYCWLHKGAFSCADKLGTGQETTQYVYYCLKYINYLLSCDIKPIMVFDGCRLPSKQAVEKARRERREINSKKAKQLLREGKTNEAREFLQRSIDITPKMALDLMKACRERGVDCIVAPYEADAQLAYLSKIGIAQIVITEDSDLVLFGCDKIMFKMDTQGNGMLVEKSKLQQAMDLRPDVYSFDKFRYMCILSGCDYLPSLPGIGLGKANKLFKLSRQTDVIMLLRKLPTVLKMSNLTVPKDYIDGFVKANNTFLYQLVYDPMKRKLLPLNPYPPEVDPKELHYAGPPIAAEKAYQIALGNIDLYTNEKVEDFDPDKEKSKTSSWDAKKNLLHRLSIWDRNYTPVPKSFKPVDLTADLPSTKGREVKVALPVLKRKPVVVIEQGMSDCDLLSAYNEVEKELLPPKRPRLESTENIVPPTQSQAHNILDIEPVTETFTFTPETGFRSPVSSAYKTSPVKSPARGKENTPSPEKQYSSSPHSDKKPSPQSDKKPARNIFAKKGNSSHGKFSLNLAKNEYKQSRFFQPSQPLPVTLFGQALREELEEEPGNSVKHETSFTESKSPAPPAANQASSVVNKLQRPVSDGSDSVKKSSPAQGAFGFRKLDYFKSSFNRNSPNSQNQFKSVISSSKQYSNSDTNELHSSMVDTKDSVSVEIFSPKPTDLNSKNSSLRLKPCETPKTSFAKTQNQDISSIFKNTPKRTFQYKSEVSPKATAALPVLPDLPTAPTADEETDQCSTPSGTNSLERRLPGSRPVGLSRTKSPGAAKQQSNITHFLSAFKNNKTAEKLPSVRS